ncbi:thymidylate synthase [Chytriomyces sp. MP71]|nr:thymidylate synthase [Chytriomyces sp. MP71]
MKQQPAGTATTITTTTTTKEPGSGTGLATAADGCAGAARTEQVANADEEQYLRIVADILATGDRRRERTGTGTRAVFAPAPMRFSLGDATLPLFTSKRVPVRAVFEELMWFVRGCTDSELLAAKGVRIWDANGSREALDRAGLVNNRVGDLGPVYGFQWRHFGAKYAGPDADYTGQGVDQLKDVIRKIKHNPTDRRILISAWNPADLDKVALPPCHLLCQFYVSTPEGEGAVPSLSCQLYQRSADMGLGVPFNVASYALFTHLLAHVTGIETGNLSIVLGDAHVYMDHMDALKTQLERVPRSFPKLRFVGASANVSRAERAMWSVEKAVEVLEGFSFDDVKVEGYDPHGKIVMQMSV